MAKKIVFVSHVREERSIAIVLKDLLERAFLGTIEVFVSSSPQSLPAGSKWLLTVSTALKKCVVEVVIASPYSVTRPWVNFEAGAGWVRDIPVIPVCHSGMTPSKLPVPLSELQAVRSESKEDLEGFVKTLANAIGIDQPKIDFSEFIASTRSHTAQVGYQVPVSIVGSCHLDPRSSSIVFRVTNKGDKAIPPYEMKIFHPKIGSWSIFPSDRRGELLPEQRRDHRCKVIDNGNVVPVLMFAGCFQQSLVEETDAPLDHSGFEMRLVMEDSDKVLFSHRGIALAFVKLIRDAEKTRVLNGTFEDWRQLDSSESEP